MTDNQPPTDEPPEEPPDDDRNDEPFDGRPEALRDDNHRHGDYRDEDDSDGTHHGGGWLSTLLHALESLERLSESGADRRDRSRLDYDVSVRSIDDAIGDRRREVREDDLEQPGRHAPGRRPGGGLPSPDREAHRGRTSTGSEPASTHLTTRRHDDEFLVTADVVGVDPDDLTVGFDDSTLVVAIDGTPLERVDVPWENSTADATVNNGILTVEIRRDER